jgi:hypothetical protein
MQKLTNNAVSVIRTTTNFTNGHEYVLEGGTRISRYAFKVLPT